MKTTVLRDSGIVQSPSLCSKASQARQLPTQMKEQRVGHNVKNPDRLELVASPRGASASTDIEQEK